MGQQQKKWFGSSALLVLALLFVGLTIVLNLGLRGARVDLTEAKLYSVSDGTKNILQSIDEPINLYFYFSDQATAEVNDPGVTAIRNYANRVRETLEEFSGYAGGKLRLDVIDPLPFSEAEDDASSFGLLAAPLGQGGDNVFLGLAGTNATDGLETIAFFEPSKEAFLEYDLARMIHSLVSPARPVLGFMSGLPMRGGFDPATRQMSQPWVVMEQIEQLYEVRNVDSAATQIDPDIDLLLLIHPQGLSDDTLFAIDQYVLQGRNLALFLDPFAELQQIQGDPNDPQTMFADRSSTLGNVLAAWGVQFDPQQVILDQGYALEISGMDGRPVRHVGILGLPADAMSRDDVALAQLSSLNLSSAGSLSYEPAEDAEATFIPLLSTSERSWQTGAQQMAFARDPRQLADSWDGAGGARVLAARLQGRLSTAFPDRVGESEQSNNLAASSDTSTVVMVADTDLLSDRLWVQVQRIFGQRLLSAFANNGDFVVNLLDNLSGSSDLISIRGRAISRRPFTRVQALEAAATEQYQATEQRLEEELRETEQKLTELQSNRDTSAASTLLLSAEQQAELERFREQQISIRKQLRQVQAGLRADVDALGTRLKLLNIFGVPLLVIFGALALRLWRRRSAAREVI